MAQKGNIGASGGGGPITETAAAAATALASSPRTAANRSNDLPANSTARGGPLASLLGCFSASTDGDPAAPADGEVAPMNADDDKAPPPQTGETKQNRNGPKPVQLNPLRRFNADTHLEVTVRIQFKREKIGIRLDPNRDGSFEVIKVYESHTLMAGKPSRKAPAWMRESTAAKQEGLAVGDRVSRVQGKHLDEIADIKSAKSDVDRFVALLSHLEDSPRSQERPLEVTFARPKPQPLQKQGFTAQRVPKDVPKVEQPHAHDEVTDEPDAMARQAMPLDSRFVVKISQFDVENIYKWAMEYPRLETGGDLFGQWLPDGNCIIKNAIGPGKGASRSSVTFNQGMEFLRSAGEYLYPHLAFHIGDWHSYVILIICKAIINPIIFEGITICHWYIFF